MRSKYLPFFLIGAFFYSHIGSADGLLRPMYENKVNEVGLIIQTEQNPEWDTKVQYVDKQPIFIAETPRNVYPPSVMMISTFDNLQVQKTELEEIAQSAIEQSAQNFGVSSETIKKLKIQPREFKYLKGYEATFDGVANGEDVTVKVFIGQETNRPVVTLTAYTYRGKISHIKEQLRRSWDNISYLSNK